MEEIVNKVKDSGLIQMDLADFKPRETIVGLDIAPQLWQGLILKEKDFRAWIKEHNWEDYAQSAVYIYCSVDAIIPAWAYMLLTSRLTEVGALSLVGTETDLRKMLIRRNIEQVDRTQYTDERIIVKGCSDIAAPEYAMSVFVTHFQPVVRSILFGEPCSTVPVYKRKK